MTAQIQNSRDLTQTHENLRVAGLTRYRSRKGKADNEPIAYATLIDKVASIGSEKGLVYPADPMIAPFIVDDTWMILYKEKSRESGYFVIASDGFECFVEEKAFEKYYEKDEPESPYTIGIDTADGRGSKTVSIWVGLNETHLDAAKEYRSHKQVLAIKLRSISFNHGFASCFPHEKSLAPFVLGEDITKKIPLDGADPGYIVIYDDGYTSWSPTKAFEEGYSEVTDDKPATLAIVDDLEEPTPGCKVLASQFLKEVLGKRIPLDNQVLELWFDRAIQAGYDTAVRDMDEENEGIEFVDEEEAWDIPDDLGSDEEAWAKAYIRRFLGVEPTDDLVEPVSEWFSAAIDAGWDAAEETGQGCIAHSFVSALQEWVDKVSPEANVIASMEVNAHDTKIRIGDITVAQVVAGDETDINECKRQFIDKVKRLGVGMPHHFEPFAVLDPDTFYPLEDVDEGPCIESCGQECSPEQCADKSAIAEVLDHIASKAMKAIAVLTEKAEPEDDELEVGQKEFVSLFQQWIDRVVGGGGPQAEIRCRRTGTTVYVNDVCVAAGTTGELVDVATCIRRLIRVAQARIPGDSDAWLKPFATLNAENYILTAEDSQASQIACAESCGLNGIDEDH